MVKIKTEIKQIEIEIKYIEEYVCDCLYYRWDDNELDLRRTLENCTKPCGNGTQTETRGKKWEKKNTGEECDVEDSKRVVRCNSECCRKACHWNAWGDWIDCSDSCSADTEQCRERTQNITDTCPTMPGKWKCDGDSKETITSCSNIKGKKDRIEELENEIEILKLTHKNEIGTCKSKVNDLRQTMCPLDCLNGGECSGVGHCTCQLGFTGSRCDQPYSVACSSGAMCKSEYCQANNLTQTPDTKWRQPWCDLSGRCLTTQESGPGHDRCHNNIGYKFLNGDDSLLTNWCQNDQMETLCPFPIVTTTTTTTTPAPTTTTTATTATPITYDIIEGGCYEDRIPPNSHRERMLAGNYGYLENNTLMACKVFCQGFNYFGVQDTYDCFCGNIIHHLKNVTASECNSLCPGNSNQKCGGPYRQNLYSINATIADTTTASTETATSTAEFNALIIGGHTKKYSSRLVDLSNTSLPQTPFCDFAEFPTELNQAYAGGALIPFNGTLMPVVCGGQRGEYCYGYKYSSGQWEIINTLRVPVGKLSLASIGRGWMFMAGGEQYRNPRGGTKSTYMLNAAGVVIDGPDMDKKRAGACPAVISEDGDTTVVAILGGGNDLTMQKFECSFGGSTTPTCLKLSNGPDLPSSRPLNSYERAQFSCGVIRTEQGQDVLYAWKKDASPSSRPPATSSALDLSSTDSTWQEVPTPHNWDREVQDGNYNFITNKNKTIGYLFSLRARYEYYKITCKAPLDCFVQPKGLGFRVAGDPTVIPVPNDKYLCP